MRSKWLSLIAILLIISNGFAIIPTFFDMNPAFVFESPRRYLDISDMGVSGKSLNNLLSLGDLNKLAKGEKVVLDKGKLDLLQGNDFVFSPEIEGSEYIGLGFGGFRLGAVARVNNTLSLNLPYEVMRIILGDDSIGFNEDIKRSFNLLNGSLSAQAGVLVGMDFGNLSLGVEAGGYLPIIAFDKDSSMTFLYYSNENTATLHIGINGQQRIYSFLSSFNNTDIDENEIKENMGYYLSAGLLYKIENLKVGFAVNNYSISPAKMKYYGDVKLSYDATLSNLSFSSSDLESEFPDTYDELEKSQDVTIPMEYSLFISYRFFSYLDTAFHAKVTSDFSRRDIGAYVAFEDLAWLDLTMLRNGLWKKEIGLNLEMNFFRLTASVGILDVGIVNFFPDRITGLSVNVGFGLGF